MSQSKSNAKIRGWVRVKIKYTAVSIIKYTAVSIIKYTAVIINFRTEK